MQTIPPDDFLHWATTKGIGFDTRYPGSDCLRFAAPTEHSRFWVLPLEQAAWPHFVATFLDGLDEWGHGFLWPRSRYWPNQMQSDHFNEGVRDVVLQGAGIPSRWDGAIRFGHDERFKIIAVLYIYMVFGWCVEDDLFFIPDHGRQILQTDHHDVIHIECRSEARILEYVEHMASAEYELPRELPDETFKRPAWMLREDEGA